MSIYTFNANHHMGGRLYTRNKERRKSVNIIIYIAAGKKAFGLHVLKKKKKKRRQDEQLFQL